MALDLIQKYANFEDTTHLSAACIHMVRYCLEMFWAELDKEARTMWQLLLKSCGVHFYLCNHTIVLMHLRRKDVMQLIKTRYAEKTVLDGSLTKSILYAATASNPRNDMGTKSVMTPTIVYEMLKAWITKPQKVSKELCIIFSTLCVAASRHILL